MADSMCSRSDDASARIAELASDIIHTHYCKRDTEAMLSYLADPFSWIGDAEDAYGRDVDNLASTLQHNVDLPACLDVVDEHYDVVELSSDTYLACGMFSLVAASPDTAERTHLRATMVFKRHESGFRCHHIHLSLPKMQPDSRLPRVIDDPERASQGTGTRASSRECLEFERQALLFSSIYETVPCGILRFVRDKEGIYRLQFYNRAAADLMGAPDGQLEASEWSRGICPMMDIDDAVKLARRMDGLAAVGDTASAICHIVQRDGTTRYVSSINRLVDTTGEGDIIQKLVLDITEHVEMERALVKISYEDALTHLYNRSRFRRDLENDRFAAVAHLGVAYFDINGLKTMNDRFGHAAGDDLILRCARIIRKTCHGDAYRIGGDEFVVIDIESEQSEFTDQVDRAIRSLTANSISVAVGTSWRTAPACDIKAQFEEADRLMYENKAAYYRTHDRRRR